MARRKKTRVHRGLLILVSITPIACLVALMVGLAVAWVVFPTRFVNAPIADLSDEHADEVVIMAAADFAEYDDIQRARDILAGLDVPNPNQYVAMVAERLIQRNRGPIEPEIENVVRLADALNVSTISMIAYVSTPTPLPPTPTATPEPTATATNTPVVEAQPEVVAVAAAAEDIPADTPEPTVTPVPPTATPQPVAAAPTNTPVPPTETPTPEPALPESEFDFFIAKQRLLTKEENGGCAGMHSIFIDVVDAAGNPIKGVQLADVWGNPQPVTGHKSADQPGHAVIDLYKNGFYIYVASDPTAGREVTSETSVMLSSNDWEIGIPRLIEAGYCPDEPTCRQLWNSGEFGVGNNSLCWGHYSWEVVFQRTW